MLVTLEKEDGHAQLGGAQAVDEAGDVVRIFTQDSLLVSDHLAVGLKGPYNHEFIIASLSILFIGRAGPVNDSLLTLLISRYFRCLVCTHQATLQALQPP